LRSAAAENNVANTTAGCVDVNIARKSDPFLGTETIFEAVHHMPFAHLDGRKNPAAHEAAARWSDGGTAVPKKTTRSTEFKSGLIGF
jgi:hypothetical protein